jgi:hypothetical protein
LHRAQLLASKGIRRDDFEIIAFDSTNESQGGARAATSVFHNGHARAQITPLFGLFNHRQRHAVFIRASRIVIFQLNINVGAVSRNNFLQLDEGGVANGR